MKAITFEVKGEPASKARARFTGQGSKYRTYTPERTRDAERRVAAAYLTVARRINSADKTTAFRVVADFHLARNQRRDVDNMLKLVLDGLNKVAWEDDSQVVEVVGRKHYHAGEGLTVVTVEPVGLVPRSESTCEHCGKTFSRPPSHAGKKYCTQECRTEVLRLARLRKCAHCGEDFDIKHPSHVKRFCSMACSQAARNIHVTCARCGAAFTKPPHLNRSGNSYCSPECKASYWRDHRKSRAYGTCDDCGKSTTKKEYKRCRDCHYAAGGRWADRDPAEVVCSECGRFRSADRCACSGQVSA